MPKKKIKKRKNIPQTVKLERANDAIGKALLIFVLTSFIGLILIFVGTFRFIFRSEICDQRVHKQLGNKWNQMVKVTDDESFNIQGLYSFVDKKNMVIRGIKEKLECENNFKYFFFF